MSDQNENTPAVGVQIKTATISSTKLAIAVAFLGAAALAAAAAAGMGRGVPQASQTTGSKTASSTFSILQPVIKKVSIEVNGNKPVSFDKSVAQQYWPGLLSGQYEKMTDGRVVVSVLNVENKAPDLMYGYYVMYISPSPLYYLENYLESQYVDIFKKNVFDNIVWSKSNQYSFIVDVSNYGSFTVFVFIKNGDNVYQLNKLSTIDDATEITMTMKATSASSTTTTSTSPIIPTPTSTPSTPTTTPITTKQPIIKEVVVEVNGTPKFAKITTNNSAMQGNLPDMPDMKENFEVGQTNNGVSVSVKLFEDDSSVLYGYYVSYDLGSVIKNYNTFFKGQITDKVVWTKSKHYKFNYTQPNFYVYVLVKNGDNVLTLPNLGIDDGTYLYLKKIITSVPIPTPTPTSTPAPTSTNTNTST